MNKYFGDDDLIMNTASRIPVCLCIDTSSSMLQIVDGEVIQTGKTEFRDGKTWNIVEGGITLLDKVNDGIKAFCDAIENNEQAKLSCELAVVTFDDVATCVHDFASVDAYRGFQITDVGDNTAMSAGINQAIRILEERKRQYKINGVDYYQPWLVLFTDGDSSEDITAIQQKTMQMSMSKKLSVFTLALTDEVNIETLKGFSPRRPLKIKEDKIDECFEWLGKSVSAVSMSQVGEKIKLDTSGLDEWADI